MRNCELFDRSEEEEWSDSLLKLYFVPHPLLALHSEPHMLPLLFPDRFDEGDHNLKETDRFKVNFFTGEHWHKIGQITTKIKVQS